MRNDSFDLRCCSQTATRKPHQVTPRVLAAVVCLLMAATAGVLLVAAVRPRPVQVVVRVSLAMETSAEHGALFGTPAAGPAEAGRGGILAGLRERLGQMARRLWAVEVLANVDVGAVPAGHLHKGAVVLPASFAVLDDGALEMRVVRADRDGQLEVSVGGVSVELAPGASFDAALVPGAGGAWLVEAVDWREQIANALMERRAVGRLAMVNRGRVRRGK